MFAQASPVLQPGSPVAPLIPFWALQIRRQIPSPAALVGVHSRPVPHVFAVCSGITSVRQAPNSGTAPLLRQKVSGMSAVSLLKKVQSQVPVGASTGSVGFPSLSTLRQV